MLSLEELYTKRNEFFIRPTRLIQGLIYFGFTIGLLTFVFGLLSGTGELQKRTWGALLLNVFFFYGISLCGVVFAAIQDIIHASWGRSIKRIHEAFASFLLLGTLLLLLILLAIKLHFAGADKLYSWIAHPEILVHYWGKRTWLQEDFMLLRDALALIVMLILAFWQVKLSANRDLAFIQGKESHAERVKRRLSYWGSAILIVYSIGFSLLSFDLTMSLAPKWFSSLWGMWNISIMFQTFFALLLVALFFFNKTPLGSIYGRQQFHDVGKLLYGFTLFFAYLTYAHVLTYWYGNVPEETEYLLHRLNEPWIYFVFIIPILVFVIPLFAFIPKPSKWRYEFALPLCIMILFAQWMTAILVVMPEIVQAQEWKFPTIELGLFFGIFAWFLKSIYWFGERVPMLGIADPLLINSLKKHP